MLWGKFVGGVSIASQKLMCHRVNQARKGRSCEGETLAYNFLHYILSYFRVFHQCITLINGKGTTDLWPLSCRSLRLCNLSSIHICRLHLFLELPVPAHCSTSHSLQWQPLFFCFFPLRCAESGRLELILARSHDSWCKKAVIFWCTEVVSRCEIHALILCFTCCFSGTAWVQSVTETLLVCCLQMGLCGWFMARWGHDCLVSSFLYYFTIKEVALSKRKNNKSPLRFLEDS